MKAATSSSKRPKFSAQRTPLAAYLSGAIGTTALFAVPQAEAAVTAVTFGFGSVLDSTAGSNYFAVTQVGGGTTFGNFHARSDGGGGNVSLGGANSPTYNNAHYPNFGTLSFFNSGTVIGSGLNHSAPSGYILGGGYLTFPGFAALTLSSDQLNKNIGFETTTGNWGWANVSWHASSQTLNINSAYVDSVAGNSITVGSVTSAPEPSRALLALAGLGGWPCAAAASR